MGKLAKSLKAIFLPTEPLTEEEAARLRNSEPATREEIEAAQEKAGWRRFLGAGG